MKCAVVADCRRVAACRAVRLRAGAGVSAVDSCDSSPALCSSGFFGNRLRFQGPQQGRGALFVVSQSILSGVRTKLGESAGSDWCSPPTFVRTADTARFFDILVAWAQMAHSNVACRRQRAGACRRRAARVRLRGRAMELPWLCRSITTRASARAIL